MYPFQRHAPSEDGPTRPIRLMFPILEHPDQRQEQAPPPHPHPNNNRRGMLYEAADGDSAHEPDYFEPLNIFWDEGHELNRTAFITPGVVIYTEMQQPSAAASQPRRSRRGQASEDCLESRAVFVIPLVFLLMICAVAITMVTLCIEPQCGVDSTASAETRRPTFIPTLSPNFIYIPSDDDNDDNDNNYNIFLRPPSPMPTLFPLEDDYSAFHSTVITRAPSAAAVIYNVTESSHNITDLSVNSTNTTSNSTFTFPLEILPNTTKATNQTNSSIPAPVNTTTSMMTTLDNSTVIPTPANTMNNQTWDNATLGATNAPSPAISIAAERKQPVGR